MHFLEVLKEITFFYGFTEQNKFQQSSGKVINEIIFLEQSEILYHLTASDTEMHGRLVSGFLFASYDQDVSNKTFLTPCMFCFTHITLCQSIAIIVVETSLIFSLILLAIVHCKNLKQNMRSNNMNHLQFINFMINIQIINYKIFYEIIYKVYLSLATKGNQCTSNYNNSFKYSEILAYNLQIKHLLKSM